MIVAEYPMEKVVLVPLSHLEGRHQVCMHVQSMILYC